MQMQWVKRAGVAVFVATVAVALGVLKASPVWANDVNCSSFGGFINVHVDANVIANVDCTIGPDGSVNGDIKADDTSVTVLGKVDGKIEQKGAGSVTVVCGGSVDGNIKEENAGDVNICVASGGSFNGSTDESGLGSVTIFVAADHLYNGNANEKDDGNLMTSGPGRFIGNTKEKGTGVCTNTIADFGGNACES